MCILRKLSRIISILTLLLAFVPLVGKSQVIVQKQTIYFNSGQSKVSKIKAEQLSILVDSIKKYDSAFIYIKGNSDSRGLYRSNVKLSQKRAQAIGRWFINNGITKNALSITGIGPDSPIATNTTFVGRQKNRRVEITVFEIKHVVPEVTQEVPSIVDLYKKIANPVQSFCVNPHKDTAIRCLGGTVILIKANSIQLNPNCADGCIKINVKEDFLKSDMILDNLSTMADSAILETQGMIYTEAIDCNGNKLSLLKDKPLTIFMPTDSINPSAKIFDGERIQDSVMNWTLNNNDVLSNFTLPDLDLCNGWICRCHLIVGCERCRFIFCRIGRLGDEIKGVYNNDQRTENISFRQCQKELKRIRQGKDTVTSTNPLTIIKRPPLPAIIVPRCQILEELFKKYGVDNVESLSLALNKPLLDSFKVTTMAQLKDTLAKVATKQIELAYQDKKISFEDYKYYVYNTAKFGWTNIDCFSGVPKKDLVNLGVKLTMLPNVDCKLVFQQRRSIVSISRSNGKFEFKGVPKGEDAWIVAIKYENGKCFLALKEVKITSGRFDVEFKELSLNELRGALKQLGQ